MSPEEMLVAVIAIVGGLGFASFLFWGVYSLIKQWINRKSGSNIDPQFFKALGEFKKNTERRISNLESIISEMEEEQYRLNETEEHKTMGEIEIEEEEVRSESKSEKDDDSNLRNMLNE
ncbi:MAG: hypothetical protein CL666_15970 [Balneola sp.]|nr:hypothetical protein [Balneola sp.]|tara:strand:- start:40016 stop:40372 length:357 start_codon:yes stop_codon:yes gene_type:complete